MMSDGTNWDRWNDQVIAAFSSGLDQIEDAIPGVLTRLTTSRNDVKPLHVVRSYWSPGKVESAIVLSSMFRFQGGSLKVSADLMQEDGPMLLELPGFDLGTNPDDQAVDRAVDAVVRFADHAAQPIINALRASDE